jgi:hypothetical protein
MIYYKELDIPNFELIVEKTRQFIVTETTLASTRVFAAWHFLNFQNYVNAVPEILTAFSEYGITPIRVAAFVTHTSADAAPHTDDCLEYARINLPIMNCEGTQTNFFEDTTSVRVTNPRTNISHNEITGPLHKIDSFEIKKATVMRVRAVHSVTMNQHNPVPRITLTIKFDKDPVFLLE